MKFVIHVCILFSFYASYGQQSNQQHKIKSDSILEILEEQLFAKSRKKILLHKFLSPNHSKIDSTQKIRLYQPDTDLVLDGLEKLMHTKDGSLYDRLLKIYNKHVKNFVEEWSDIYTKNYYAPPEVIDQYSVLAGFEIVLKSLSFAQKKMSTEEIWDYYEDAMRFSEKFIFEIDKRCELMKEYDDISAEFRNLNPCRLYYGNITFTYIDPYVDALKGEFISLMNKCEWEGCKYPDNRFECRMLVSSERFINLIEATEISQYYINNFDQMKACNRHTMAYRYASDKEDKLLSVFLIDKFINNKEVDYRYPYMEVFVSQNPVNMELFINEIVDLYKKDQAKAEEIISPIPKAVMLEALKSDEAALRELIESNQ